MKKLMFIAMIALACAMSAQAQTKHDSVVKLIGLMQQDAMIDKMFEGMSSTIAAQMQAETKTPEEQAKAKEGMDKMFVKVKEISKRLINEDMVTLYEKYFTQEDIDNYIKFYGTPSGKKMIAVMPDMQKDIMNVVMTKYMPELKASIAPKEATPATK